RWGWPPGFPRPGHGFLVGPSSSSRKSPGVGRARWDSAFRARASGLLHGAQQRVLVESRIFVDLRHLGFGDFTREDAANAAAAGVDVQHDLGGLVEVHAEEADQYVDHEVHRGVVVVQQQDGIKRRPRHLRLAGLHGNAVLVFLVVVGWSGHRLIIATAARCPAGVGSYGSTDFESLAGPAAVPPRPGLDARPAPAMDAPARRWAKCRVHPAAD